MDSRNDGWGNFRPSQEPDVTVEDNRLEGFVWAENIGGIKFDYAGFSNPFEKYVKTTWRINGDINSDGTVTLEDAIMMLQVCAGISPTLQVHSGADVTEDSRIGLDEAAYILQRVSGIRTE